MSDSRSAQRSQTKEEIRRAAIGVFAAQGFRGTSMADLAAAAGYSRPTLYNYFDNRADIFRAAFEAFLQDSADAALAALASDGTIVERLDGYLQRAHGDGYEALATTPFGEELMEARHEFAADVAEAALDQMRRGLRSFIQSAGEPSAPTSAVIDLLTLSPTGLKADGPSPAVYRRRLTALAQAAAGLMEST